MGKLYLLPNSLGESALECVLPNEVISLIRQLRVFATENPKNTRRFLKKIDKTIDIDSLIFLDLNEHSTPKEIEACLPWLEKEDMGIISEAGWSRNRRSGSRTGCVGSSSRLPGMSPCRSFFYPIGTYGFRLQRTTFFFQRLSACER